MQVCPALRNFAHTILFTVIFKFADWVTIAGLLPPSSSVTGIRFFAAA